MSSAVKTFAILACISLVPKTLGAQLISTINVNGDFVIEDVGSEIPEERAIDINQLHFYLYTRANKEQPYELKKDNLDNLRQSPFGLQRQTKFLIHGWESSYVAAPIQNLKNGFLDAYDVNVIILDYEAYNSPYLDAVSHAKNVGKTFASLVEYLISNGLQHNDIHIVGHSLGGHIAGFLGKQLSPKAKRITGLDPAGPMFKDKGENGRLDANDAEYVDVIYTSTLAGISKSIGQANFFPNGGENQPMCEGTTVSGGCDHTAGFTYYVNSLVKGGMYTAKKCANDDEAKVADVNKNKCKISLAVMGEEAIKRSPSGIYFVAASTLKEEPGKRYNSGHALLGLY